MTREQLVLSAPCKTGYVVCSPLRPEYAKNPRFTLGVDMGALDAPTLIPTGKFEVEVSEHYLFVSCGVVGRGS